MKHPGKDHLHEDLVHFYTRKIEKEVERRKSLYLSREGIDDDLISSGDNIQYYRWMLDYLDALKGRIL